MNPNGYSVDFSHIPNNEIFRDPYSPPPPLESPDQKERETSSPTAHNSALKTIQAVKISNLPNFFRALPYGHCVEITFTPQSEKKLQEVLSRTKQRQGNISCTREKNLYRVSKISSVYSELSLSSSIPEDSILKINDIEWKKKKLSKNLSALSRTHSVVYLVCDPKAPSLITKVNRNLGLIWEEYPFFIYEHLELAATKTYTNTFKVNILIPFDMSCPPESGLKETP